MTMTGVGLELWESHEPTSYAEHEDLLRALQSDPTGLKSARNRFSHKFPLAPPLWIAWLNDEIEHARSADDRRFIAEELFPKALRDYLSVDIADILISFQARRWHLQEIEYVEFRRCFEGLVIPSGSCRHYLDGVKIWRKYREELMKHGIPKEEQAVVFSEQLSLPLRGNYEEAVNTLTRPSESHLSLVTASRNDLLDVLDAFESKLVNAGSNPSEFSGARSPDLTLQYAAYASCEEERNALSACIIWERCVAECFLDESAWLMYNDYCRRCRQSLEMFREQRWGAMITGDMECHVMYRAVRNVPWSMQLWTALVSALSRSEHSEDRALRLEDATSMAAPNVAQSQDSFGVEQLSRRIVVYASRLRSGGFDPKLCQNIIDTAVSFNAIGTSSWASVLSATGALDPDQSTRQQILESIVMYRAHEATWWIGLAKTCVDRDSRMAVYCRALNEMTSISELDSLTQAWLTFELHIDIDNGAKDLLAGDEPRECVEYRDDWLDDAMRAFRGRRFELEVGYNSAGHSSSPVEGSSRKRSNPIPLKPRRKKGKQSGGNAVSESNDFEVLTRKGGRVPGKVDTEVVAIVPKHGYTDSDIGRPETLGRIPRSDADQINPGREKGKDDLTPFEPRVIYVNNLSYTVTEDHIHDAFATVGKVQDIRLPRRKDGALKGFAYVEFEDDAAVEAALALDKMQISGREAWVRRSKPPKPKRPAGDASAKSANMAGQAPSPSAPSAGNGPTAGKRSAFKPAFRTPRTFPQTSLAHGAGTGDDVDMRHDGHSSARNGDSIVAETEERSQLKQEDFRAMLARK